jgi:drug/metabolite transporter (DMT)-like permease
MSNRRKAELALIAMAFIWGSSFVVMKNALHQASPAALLVIRFWLAAVLMLGLIWTMGVAWTKQGGRWIALAGIFLAVGYILQTSGLRHTTAGKSGFLTGLYIVLLPLLTSVVYQSAPQPREWAGVLMSALGMAAMNWDGTRWSWGPGETLTVGCAVMFAAHLMALDRAVQEMDPKFAGLCQIFVAAAVLTVMLPWLETPRVDWSPGLATAIVFTAAAATALPLTLMGWAQRHTTPVRTGLLLSLEMPFAALAGWIWLSEPFHGMMRLGAGLILAGVLIVELKPGGVPVHLEDVDAPMR